MSSASPVPGTPEWDVAIAQLEASQQPILSDLRAAGHSASSIWLFEGSSDALPILVSHFERGDYPSRVMDALGAAIARSGPAPYWDRLENLYRHARSEGEATGAVAALASAASADRVGDLAALLTDDTLGAERVLLIRPLLRTGEESGRRFVRSLVDHPVLGHEASLALASEGAKRHKRFLRARARLDAEVAMRAEPELDAAAVEWSASFTLADGKRFAKALQRKLGGEFAGPLGTALIGVVETAPQDDEDHVLLHTNLGAVRIGWFIDDFETVDVYIFGAQGVHDLCTALYRSSVDGEK